MIIISSNSSAGSKDDAVLEFGVSDSDWLEEFGCRHESMIERIQWRTVVKQAIHIWLLYFHDRHGDEIND